MEMTVQTTGEGSAAVRVAATTPAPSTAGRGRTVLVLTYRWPPQGGVSVQRVTKFVKYLARQGWRPVIHTVTNPYAPVKDSGLARDVPAGVPVYRTPTVEWEAIESSLAGLVKRLRGGKSGGNGARGDGAPSREADTATVGRTEREARTRRHGQLGALGN